MTLADLYADEGITGTAIEKRDEFKRMMKDAQNRKIDRIVVKSVTRFARNALECIESVRKLKSYGVSVLFENDHIDTAGMSSEMVLYIKSAFAEKEALSASKRMATSNRMRMEMGAYITPTVPYGYVLADCVLTVVESQAKKVRDIFSLYLNGYGVSSITRIMREREDTDMVWKRGLVQYILSNEKYIGDSLMQKSYTPTMLPLRSRKNKGQMPMYYAENTHEAIISKEVFEQVKEIRANRAKKYYIPSEKNPLFFQGKIYCRKCGWSYKKRMRDDGVYWTCTKRSAVGVECHSFTYSNAELERAFVQMYNTLKQNSRAVVDETLARLTALKTRVNSGNNAISEIDEEIASLGERTKRRTTKLSTGFMWKRMAH